MLEGAKVYKDYYFIVFMELNKNDEKLIEFCVGGIKSVGQIAKHLNIAPKNVSVRLKKLEEKKLIIVQKQGRGKKTLVKSYKPNKKLLKEIIKYVLKSQKSGYRIQEAGIYQIFQEKGYDFFEIMQSLNILKFEHYLCIVVTNEGRKFLKKDNVI